MNLEQNEMTTPNHADAVRAALEKVARWELPETGETWPSGGAVSYETLNGSRGVQHYFQELAAEALALSQPAASGEVAQPDADTVRDAGRAEAYRRCANSYLGMLGVKNPEQALGEDIRDPDMCGDAAIDSAIKGEKS